MMSNALLQRVYLYGYQRRKMPRWIRQAFARSEIHRAWLLGYDGCFAEGDVKYGPAKPYSQLEDW